MAAASSAGLLRGLPLPSSARRRQRLLVCTAAAILTAIGVRVEVKAPAVAWPRGSRLVVSNHMSWLDSLALLTAVPGTLLATHEVAGWPVIGQLIRRAGAEFVDRAMIRSLPTAVSAVADRLRAGGTVVAHPEGTTSCGAQLGRFRPAFFQAAVDSSASVCPVAIRYRTGNAATTVAGAVEGDSPIRFLRRVVAARDLVVEVHLLPALRPSGADRRVLAALSEYAIAELVETRAPLGAHVRTPRRLPVGAGTDRPLLKRVPDAA